MFRAFDALRQSPYADTALAEFIREPIVQGTNEGLDAARGARPGRPPAMAEEQVRVRVEGRPIRTHRGDGRSGTPSACEVGEVDLSFAAGPIRLANSGLCGEGEGESGKVADAGAVERVAVPPGIEADEVECNGGEDVLQVGLLETDVPTDELPAPPGTE